MGCLTRTTERTRTSKITVQPRNGGTKCPAVQTDTKNCAVDCIASFDGVPWSVCSPDGNQTRRAVVTQQAFNIALGAKPCPAQAVKPCPYLLHTVVVMQHNCSGFIDDDSKPTISLVDLEERSSTVTTISKVCSVDLMLPRSKTDDVLLAGNMEPDTPFAVKFQYKDPKTKAVQDILIGRSSTMGGLACPTLPSRTPLYKVDQTKSPRKISFCASMCNTIRASSEGVGHPEGMFILLFKPVAKMGLLQVSGRGEQAQAFLAHQVHFILLSHFQCTTLLCLVYQGVRENLKVIVP